MKHSVHFSSSSNEWETPEKLFNQLNDQWGFTLDPCATDNNAKCCKFYTKVDDGLSKSWEGEIVFMNPPFGREIGSWVKKAYMESMHNGAIVVCLIPARTDTAYWHDYIFGIEFVDITFLRGRIQFERHSNMVATSAPFPSAIIVFNGKLKDAAATAV